MGDRLFADFEKWICDREKVWESIGLKIANRNYTETHRHSYTVTLVNSCGGTAEITLYESNSLYWVDFECWNGVSQELFVLVDIQYTDSSSLSDVEKEFEKYMCLK